MDTGRRSTVGTARPPGLALAATFALLVALGAGCMSPRPFGRGEADGLFTGDDGRFDPSAAYSRWDDLREPAVRFLHQRQWSLTASESVVAEFSRRFASETAVRGGLRVERAEAQDRIRLKPALPIAIPEPFDTVEIGLEARGLGPDAPAPATIAAEARLWVEDANGRRLAIELGGIPHAQVLRQRHLGPTFLREAVFPFSLVEIEVLSFRGETVELFFDDIAFYPQCRIPLPSRYTSDTRAWPRRSARIRDHLQSEPVAREPDVYRHEVRREGDGFVLTAVGPSGRLVYRVAPCADGYMAVEFEWDDRLHGRWPGIRIESDIDAADARTLPLYRIDAQTVGWMAGGNVRAEVRLAGAGLRVRASGGRETVRMTILAPDLPLRRLYLPFLNDGPGGGPAVYGDGQLAVAVFPDPLVSRASRLGFAAAGDPEGYPAAWSESRPASDGRRAWMEEEVVLMVAPELADVLPAPPSWGASDVSAPAADRLWLDRVRASPDQLQRLRAFGMASWTIPDDWPEDEAAWSMNDELRPGDSGWTRDALLRDSDGHWVEGAMPGAYRMKMDAVRTRARMHRVEDPLPALLLRAPWSERAPWALADYDARTYGAACFRPGVEAFAGLLHDAHEESGIRWVGGDVAPWWYASLLDAWRVGGDRGRRLWAGPLIPVVSQVVLRPRVLGVGVGGSPTGDAWSRETLDRYLALHVAYGLALHMPPAEVGVPALSRLYHPARVVQCARDGQAVVELAYEVQGRMQPLVRVLSSGASRDLDRLYIRYANGLELWVNGSFRDDWTVRPGSEPWVLPPSGWIASGAGILAFVARGADGAVTAGARTAGLEFWDGDGRDAAPAGVGGTGQILAFGDESAYGEMTVLDISGVGALRVAPAKFGVDLPVTVEAHDLETGDASEAAWEEMPDGFVHLRGPARPTRYRIRMR